MLEFLRKFAITGFEKGDYTYGTIHVMSIVILLVSLVVTIIWLKGKDKEYINNKLRYLAIFTLSIYFIRRGVMVYQGDSIIKAFWPFYLCNVNTVFLSIYLIFNIQKGKDFFVITGLAGAVLMFVVPEGVFNDRYLTLKVFDSLLSHYEIIFIPIVLMATKAYELEIKNSWQVIVGLLLVTINVEFLQKILINEHVDYLFLKGTLPFTIDGVHQFYVMFLSAIVFVYFMYFINYLLLGKIVVNQNKRIIKT